MKKLLIVSLLSLLLMPAMANALSESESKDTVVFTANNVVVLNSEVNDESVGIIISKVRELNDQHGLESLLPSSKRPIYLYLTTPGGSISAGLHLIEALKGSKRPVHTVTSFAASMGFQIAQHLGDRLILRSGTLMSHRASGQVGGSFGGRHPSQMDNRYAYDMNIIEEMDQQTVKRTNGKQTMKSYQQAYADELWMSGEQSVAGGYADRIVIASCDDTLMGSTEHSADFMGLTISYKLDNCPLNPTPSGVQISIKVIVKNVKNAPLAMNFEEFLSKNGGFGPGCAYNNTNSVCAADPTITLKDIYSIIENFKESLTNQKDHVIEMKF